MKHLMALIALVAGGCCWSYTPPRVAEHNFAVLNKAIQQTSTNGGSLVPMPNGMVYMVIGNKSNALDLIDWGWPPGQYSFWGPGFPNR